MLRIVGGRLGGRRLAVPKGRHTRPTADMVREGMFNTLANLVDWPATPVLDLFAGTGALGIEALSRGAPHCTFVESHARTAALVRRNLAALGLDSDVARVETARVEAWLERPRLPRPVGLVLMDPPYAFTGYEAVLARLAALESVADEALVVVETGRERPLEAPSRLAPLRTKRYGDTHVWFFTKRAVEAVPPAEQPSP